MSAMTATSAKLLAVTFYKSVNTYGIIATYTKGYLVAVKYLKTGVVSSHRFSGFALPTVLVASVIMLTVLTTTLAITAAIRMSVKTQNYGRLMRTANEAGAAYAQSCADAGNEVGVWTTTNPLTPGTNCAGQPISICTDSKPTEGCSVLYDDENNIASSFKITSASKGADGKLENVHITSSVALISNSTGNVRKEYTNEGGSVATTLSLPVSWKQVSSGANHTCAISSGDKLYCWGFNYNWGLLGDGSSYDSNIPIAVDTTGVLKDKKILSVSTGFAYSCAVADDHRIYCWGFTNYGQFGDGSSYSTSMKPKKISAGALENKDIVSVTAGFWHTCAIDSDGVAYCWGLNDKGQLGNNLDSDGDSISDNSVLPVPVHTGGVMAGKKIASVAIGQRHTCAISTDNKVYCWGDNSWGQLGDGTTTSTSLPVEITNSGALNGKVTKSISIGIYSGFTCAIATDVTLGDQAYCWGLNNSYQLGDGLGGQDPNNAGQFYKSTIPKAVDVTGVLSGKTVKSISLGRQNTCAIAASADGKNQVYCWGYNYGGAVGVPMTSIYSTDIHRPVAVTIEEGVLKDKTILSLSTGTEHSCVIASDGQMYCWGDDENVGDSNNGVLGNGANVKSFVPVGLAKTGILSGRTVKSITAGGYGHTCAISDEDKAYCWGYNYNGQLGNNTKTTSRIPVPVYIGTVEAPGALYGKVIKLIETGRVHDYTCAIAADASSGDQIYCWGDNASGQLGNNSKTQTSVPIKVNTDGALSGLTIKSMALGRDFACVIASDDQPYCWGANSLGQLGDGTTTQSLVPVKVKTDGVLNGKKLVSISSGTFHTCALDSDGAAYCWGYNSNRDLGNVSVTGYSSTIPVVVSNMGLLSGKTIKAISAGEQFTCVIASDDQAYCWGLNDRGQLGGGLADTQSYDPVKVTANILDSKTIKSISAGTYSSCLLASDSQVYCWGWNVYGQLGDGNKVDAIFQPVRVFNTGVLASKTITSVSVGLGSSCAIADNLPYCWGSNQYGQLGDNSVTDSPVPISLFTSLTYPSKYVTYY